ncbi:MAG TPA: class I SAM-dependent methyltransferase [Lacunisphaera sp.]|nr:class I SAM-dependent methyltransferase [Lacunisphaera sp.]
MWNERYAGDEYFYGTEPNTFLADNAKLLTGPVLSLCEGEGRNAVFLASLGLDVLGVDASEVGLAKAQKLAAAKGVTIRTEVADLAVYEPPINTFGSVVSIFAHLPSSLRTRLYPLVLRSLKPGGIVLLEAYTPAQIPRDTGGPKDPDMLMSAVGLRREFPNCEVILARELDRNIAEGLHRSSGVGSVVQFIGRKKVSL